MITTVPPRPRTPTPTGAVTDRFPAMRPASSSIDPPTVKLVLTRPLAAAAAAVTSSASRVRGVDAARGIALLGMIAAHTLPLAEGGQPTMAGRLVNGPAAALFGVLAGLSVAMLTGRRRLELGTEPARRYALRLVVRGLAIGSLGLALGQAALGSIDVILTYYGVLFVLAVPLVFLSTRVLAVLGAVLTVLAPVTGFLLRAQLPPTELLDPSFTMLVTDPAGLLTTLMFTGAYPVWPWLAYLCIGIAVGRLRLDNTRVAAALAGGGVLLAVVATVASELILQAAGGLEQLLAHLRPLARGARRPLRRGAQRRHADHQLVVARGHPAALLHPVRPRPHHRDLAGGPGLHAAARPPDRALRLQHARPGPDRCPGPPRGGRVDDLDLLRPARRGHRAGPGEPTRGSSSSSRSSPPWPSGRSGSGASGVDRWRRAWRSWSTPSSPPRPERQPPTTAARPRVGSRLQSALAVTVLVVVVAAGAGVALAFPASQDTAAATSAESEHVRGDPGRGARSRRRR